MATETLPVTQIDSQEIHLGSPSRTFCTRCSASSACGYGLLQRFAADGKNADLVLPRQWLDQNSVSMAQGDQAVVNISDTVLIRLSFFMYLVPLSFMLAVVLLMQFVRISEWMGILLSYVALAAGFAFIYVWGRNTDRLFVKVKMASPTLQLTR
jgi:positive regulator of sigma E activity